LSFGPESLTRFGLPALVCIDASDGYFRLYTQRIIGLIADTGIGAPKTSSGGYAMAPSRLITKASHQEMISNRIHLASGSASHGGYYQRLRFSPLEPGLTEASIALAATSASTAAMVQDRHSERGPLSSAR
jgi:hypothetical protein